MKRVLLLSILVIWVLLLSACGAPTTTPEAEAPPAPPSEQPSAPAPTPPAPVPEEEPAPTASLVKTPPASYRLDVPVLFSPRGALCYACAAGMAAKLLRPTLDFPEVVAFSGVGSHASATYDGTVGILSDGLMQTCIIPLAENLGLSFVLGAAKNGILSPPRRMGFKFDEAAIEVVQFDSEEDAFDFLKRVIASGYPAVVYVDHFYLGTAEHWAHYMTVTGYDEGKVYLNDPGDSGKDFPAGTGSFLNAWEKSADLPPGRGTRMGPYWMVFFIESGKQKSPSEIIAWNNNISSDVPQEIRQYADNPQLSTLPILLRCLAVDREYYSQFLEANNRPDAAQLYRESGELLSGLFQSSDPARDLFLAADKEEQAQKLLAK